MSFSSDASILIANDNDQGVMRWRVDQSRAPDLAVIPENASEVIPLSANGEWFSVIDWNDRLQVWHTGELTSVFGVDGDFQYPQVSAVSANGTYVAGVHYDEEIHVWRVRGTNQPMRLVGLRGRQINAIAFSPGEDLLAATADDRSILTWRIPPFGGDLAEMARAALPLELSADEREEFFLPAME